MPSPKNTREVQRVTGRVAALTRFISRSTDKCLPFYQMLKGNKRFAWGSECEQAFQDLKRYLTTPPVLAKPVNGETLYLYVAVSEAAVSGVLVREEKGEQKPVYYVSKTLLDAETRYSTTEKLALAVFSASRKLRPYFQAHTIVVLSEKPLRAIMHSPNQSGRLTKWAIELSEFDIDYQIRTSMKSQVLADFLVELPAGSGEEEKGTWNLMVDGASNARGAGAGVHLVSPSGEVMEQSFRMAFRASNNEAEYEALIAGLRLAKVLGAKSVKAHSDSQLVVNQVTGEFETREERMENYCQVVKELSSKFDSFTILQIPRSENALADALAALGSTTEPRMKRVIPVETLEEPSILAKSVNSVTEEVVDWRTPIKRYIQEGSLPTDKLEARKLRMKSSRYTVIGNDLYLRSFAIPYLRCLGRDDSEYVMREIHEGECGNHSGGRSLIRNAKRQGFFWETMIRDCKAFAKRCARCQKHAPMILSPTEELSSVCVPYPFMKWSMD